MKLKVYMMANNNNSDSLNDKIIELGYSEYSRHIWSGTGFEIYSMEILPEDLIILKLSVPFVEIDKYSYGP